MIYVTHVLQNKASKLFLLPPQLQDLGNMVPPNVLNIISQIIIFAITAQILAHSLANFHCQ